MALKRTFRILTPPYEFVTLRPWKTATKPTNLKSQKTKRKSLTHSTIGNTVSIAGQFFKAENASSSALIVGFTIPAASRRVT